MSIKNELSV